MLLFTGEALTQGFEEGEQPSSRETILHVIAPDVRAQENRFLDGRLPADNPAARHMAGLLKAVGLDR
jgi:hypothetical protein